MNEKEQIRQIKTEWMCTCIPKESTKIIEKDNDRHMDKENARERERQIGNTHRANKMDLLVNDVLTHFVLKFSFDDFLQLQSQFFSSVHIQSVYYTLWIRRSFYGLSLAPVSYSYVLLVSNWCYILWALVSSCIDWQSSTVYCCMCSKYNRTFKTIESTHHAIDG